MIFYWVIIALSFIVFLMHLFGSQKPKTTARIVELMLLYQLVFNMGILSLFAFFGLTFLPNECATYNGWSTCAFQQELANVNLGYSALGFLAIWLRGHFWTATVIGSSIWLIADGIHHLIDAYYYKNLSRGNTEVLPFTDIILPCLLLVLLYFYLRKVPRKVKGKVEDHGLN